MRPHPRKAPAVILLAAVVACAGPAAGEEYRLVGDTEAVWLIESAEGQYELAAKPLDKPWVSHWGAKSGDISAAAAVRDSVVLFFAQGGHARYFAHGPEGRPGINAPKHLWPAGTIAVAACPAGGGEFDAVLVLVSNPERGFSAAGPRPLPGTRTTESTRPAATATSLPQAATMQTARGPLALLRYAGQQWEQLAVVPDRFVHPPFRAHMARHEGAVYVLLDQKPTSALIVFEHGAWGRLRLPEDAAGIKPLALLGMPEGIALAAFASEGRVGIARWASGRWSGLQVVRRDDQPGPLSQGLRPGAAAIGLHQRGG